MPTESGSVCADCAHEFRWKTSQEDPGPLCVRCAIRIGAYRAGCIEPGYREMYYNQTHWRWMEGIHLPWAVSTPEQERKLGRENRVYLDENQFPPLYLWYPPFSPEDLPE